MAQSDHWQLLRGQRAYHNKAFAEAEKLFAPIKRVPVAAFNAGNAAFQQEKHPEAVGYFMDAADQFSQPSDKSDAFYNAGNALLRAGNYQSAADAYKKSLRLTPNRADAKQNLCIAQKNIPPPPDQTPPPPPPPPPRSTYLDQARTNREPMPQPLTPDAARQLLESAVAPVEEESAKRYRHLAPSNRPSRSKKAW